MMKRERTYARGLDYRERIAQYITATADQSDRLSLLKQRTRKF